MHKARVRTLQALIRGLPCLHGHPSQASVLAEYGEVYAVRKIRRGTRRRILEVLHSTRALDSALSHFVGHHGCRGRTRSGRPARAPNSLGGYLMALRDHTVAGLRRLPAAQQSHFQSHIVDVRNRYMHEADAYPVGDREVQLLLAEMDACLAAVVRL